MLFYQLTKPAVLTWFGMPSFNLDDLKQVSYGAGDMIRKRARYLLLGTNTRHSLVRANMNMSRLSIGALRLLERDYLTRASYDAVVTAVHTQRNLDGSRGKNNRLLFEWLVIVEHGLRKLGWAGPDTEDPKFEGLSTKEHFRDFVETERTANYGNGPQAENWRYHPDPKPFIEAHGEDLSHAVVPKRGRKRKRK